MKSKPEDHMLEDRMRGDATRRAIRQHGRLSALLNQLSADVAELSKLKRMLREASDPDCRDCDGGGIYMGNVCICGCVSVHNIKLSRSDRDDR